MNKMRLLLILAASGAAAGCTAERSAAGKSKILHVSGRTYLSNAPVFIADDEGYFKAEGLTIVYVPTASNTTRSIPLLENGKMDVLFSAASAGLFNAIAKGTQIRLVADKQHLDPKRCPYSAIVATRSRFGSRTLTANDVRGKRFAVSSAAGAGYLASHFLKSLGLSLRDMQIVTIPETAAPQALESGSIDLLFASEPWLTRLRPTSRILAADSALVPRFEFVAVVFGPKLLHEDRDLGRKFLRAYLRGIERFREGQTARNLQILSRRMQLDTTELKKMCWPEVSRDGTLDTAALREFQEWSVGTGNQSRVVKPSEYLDQSLLTEARSGK